MGIVGAGGFLFGGGISISAPQYGWSCDTLISAELVLADGSVLVVDQTHHAELFKALKGGAAISGSPPASPCALSQSMNCRSRLYAMSGSKSAG